MARLSQRPWFPGAVNGAAALAVAASATAPLALGGLAPVAVAALVAALVGVPIARAEWRLRPDQRSRTGIGLEALGEVLLIAWLAATWASTMPGWMGAGVGILCWAAAWALVRIRAGLAVVALAGLCLVQGALATALGWLEAAPWTLLAPQWAGWSAWLPWSLVSGLLLAGAGVAHWTRGARPHPGTGYVPWLPAGGALLLLLGVACRTGSRFESELGWAPDSLLVGLGLLVVCTAAASALAVSERAGRMAVLGGVLALWFGGPAADTVPWVFQVWLPLGLVALLGWRARHAEGLARIPCAVGAVLALVALGLGWPGVPDAPPTAVAAALTGVGLAWIAATRAMLEAR